MVVDDNREVDDVSVVVCVIRADDVSVEVCVVQADDVSAEADTAADGDFLEIDALDVDALACVANRFRWQMLEPLTLAPTPFLNWFSC